MPSAPTYHLHFHAPCFDGITSAVLMHDFLSLHEGAGDIVLHPVNYHLNDTWATASLPTPSAVVDFLYHPMARIWFDHHPTTFLTPAFEREFRRRQGPLVVHDPASTSCALLLWNRLRELVDFSGDRAEKVQAADRIDSARYESPEESIFSAAPALRINASLSIGEAEEYSQQLVVELLAHSLQEVADSPVVLARYHQFEELRDRGLERFRTAAHLEDDGVVVFDVDGSDAMVSRYAPFLFFPQARYSLGLVRNGARGKITAMRNPWMEFPSMPLGEIFSRFGGGGHRRVASTRLQGNALDEAAEPLQGILQAMRGAMASQR